MKKVYSCLLSDPRCVAGEMGSSELQHLGQVVGDMDGQFSSGVYYETRKTEASASCLPCWTGLETKTKEEYGG